MDNIVRIRKLIRSSWELRQSSTDSSTAFSTLRKFLRDANVATDSHGALKNEGLLALFAALINAVLVACNRRAIGGGGPYATARRWERFFPLLPLSADEAGIAQMDLAKTSGTLVYNDTFPSLFSYYDTLRALHIFRISDNVFDISTSQDEDDFLLFDLDNARGVARASYFNGVIWSRVADAGELNVPGADVESHLTLIPAQQFMNQIRIRTAHVQDGVDPMLDDEPLLPKTWTRFDGGAIIARHWVGLIRLELIIDDSTSEHVMVSPTPVPDACVRLVEPDRGLVG